MGRLILFNFYPVHRKNVSMYLTFYQTKKGYPMVSSFFTKPFFCFTLLLLGLFIGTPQLQGQQLQIRGQVIDVKTNFPIENVEVLIEGTKIGTTTDAEGFFVLQDIPPGSQMVVFNAPNYIEETRKFSEGSGRLDLGKIYMETNIKSEGLSLEENIPTITLDADDLNGDNTNVQNISGLLTATRDPFLAAAAFTFGPRRFRIRGYDSRNTAVFINGAPMNDLEIGRAFWANWGGLNDVFRNQNNAIGMDDVGFSIGGIGGSTLIDARASRQRPQLRVSYANSNRAYRHRLMATYSTGRLTSGWAFSASVSKRWAEEGYVEGTFYDAYSYFLSIDKEINEKHAISLTAFGAPSRRGRNGPATQEWYDIAENNYYNPYWGFQNGEKRNSRVNTAHQPVAILSHDWKISKKSSLLTAVSYQTGRYGTTALDWYNVSDPRPEYYRKAPSYMRLVGSEEQADIVEQLLRENEDLRQVDWDYMYEVNRNSFETIENANGTGETISGNRSQYILSERRFDSQKINFNTIFESFVNNQLTIDGGATYQYYHSDNYNSVVDLLGGDFYLDINKFLEFEAAGEDDLIQNDLNQPNRILREGDRFWYDYDATIHKALGWVQASVTTKKLDYFAGVEVSNTRFWRTGDIQSGVAPDNSLGDSEKSNFLNYKIKAGATYKIDGRNYLFVNGAYLTRAPFFRNSFIGVRQWNQVVPNLQSEEIASIEGGYLIKSPKIKGRLVGYYTQFNNQVFNRNLFQDDGGPGGAEGGFRNYVMTGISKRHMGLEAAFEIKASPTLSFIGAAAIGEHIYNDRPEQVTVYDGNNFNADPVAYEEPVYIENFYVPGTPQSAYTLGLNYRSKQYWFANINFNYVHRVYMDFFPDRRTTQAVSYTSDPQYVEQIVEPGSDLWRDILYQEKTDGQFSIDIFAGKSWKINDVFIYLNVGVNNLLNDQNFISGGFEQSRFDFENKEVGIFPNRYYYAYGLNYFASVTLRM